MVNPFKQGGDNRTNRSGVNPAVAMSARDLINGAGIQAGTTANTGEGFGVFPRIHCRASVVYQNDIKMVGSVGIIGAAGT